MTLGCSRLSAFRKVALPLALPGLAAAAIFVFVIVLERGVRRVDPDASGTGRCRRRCSRALDASPLHVPLRRRLLPARAVADRHLLHPQVPVHDVGTGGRDDDDSGSKGRVMADIRFEGVRKTFGKFAAVDDVDLEVQRRRVRRPARALGLRQDDAAPLPRRARAGRRRARAASAVATRPISRRDDGASRWSSRATRSSRT